MFSADSRRPVASGPPVGNRPVLALGKTSVGREPVGTFPTGFLAEDRAQFLEPVVERTEPQFARAATLQGRIADIVVGAVHLVNAGRDVAAAGGIGPKTTPIHVPEIEAGLAINNPLRDHLANSAGPGDAMRAKTTGGPQAAHLRRFAENKFSIRRKRLQAVYPPDQFHML